MVQADILKEFSRDGALTLRVSGSCMPGAFADGAKITVQQRRFYLPGDVLVYARADDVLVAHRLLGYLPGLAGWRVLTKADDSRKADHPAALARVLGRVESVDGVGFGCGLWLRVSSALGWLPGVLGWLRLRLGAGGF